PGTVRLCRKKYSGGVAEQFDDYILFIDAQLSGPVCSQSDDCSAPNGNCGVSATYVDPGNLPVHIGYVVPSYNANDDDNDGMPYSVEIAEGRNPSGKDNDIFNVARLFVFQQTKDMLHRVAQDNEVLTLSAQITSGQKTRQAAVEEFINNPEHYNIYAPIIRLYRAYFNRIPDYGGLEYHATNSRGGTPLAIIAQQFAASQEFLNRVGNLTDGQFVNFCYESVLGRPADPGGYNYWFGQLQSGAMNRGQVMLGFSESAEFIGLSVNKVRTSMLYQAMLRRTADQGGFDFYVGLLNSGTSFLALVSGFFGSAEYYQRFL
ncbi:MAG: DUF4214 domain-containing protein, partial [bacterium]